MDFVVNFLWYLLAFVVGAVVVRLVLRATVEATTADEAFADLAEGAGR